MGKWEFIHQPLSTKRAKLITPEVIINLILKTIYFVIKWPVSQFVSHEIANSTNLMWPNMGFPIWEKVSKELLLLT